jgi:TetR/AcrR family transcriptional regulator, regulator of autoinduction and epiphytic fitness
MSEEVKTRRRYDSRRRRAQAAQTRRDIVAAAHQVFLDRGYAGTTMAAVAEAAGVVVETVYRAFGSKAGLFKAVIEAALAGGVERAEIAVEQRPAIRAVIAETDPRRQLELYARTQPGIHRRIGPLMKVLAGAAAADAALAAVARQLDEQRLAGMGGFANLLAERGALRPGMSVDEARDLMWTLASHPVYDLLVNERGWAPERYRDWLADTLARAVLAG